MHVHLITFLFLSVFSTSFLHSQTTIGSSDWVPLVINYDVGQSFFVCKDSSGLVYSSGATGVNVFDGENWRNYKLPQGDVAYSLKLLPDNSIAVGSQSDFGYLDPMDDDGTAFHSLKPFTDSSFSQSAIWNITYAQGQIYFMASDKIITWDGERIGYVHPKSTFTWSGLFHGCAIIHDKKQGLLIQQSDSLKLMPVGKQLVNKSVSFFSQISQSELLIGTNDQLFIYSDQRPYKLESDLYDLLTDDIIRHGVVLSNGNIAIATRRNGVVCIDQKGKIQWQLNEDSGLGNNEINRLFVDQQGDLWGATGSGVSRILLSSGLTYSQSLKEINAGVVDIAKHQGKVFLATQKGLFYVEKGVLHATKIDAPCWSLLSKGDDLLVVSDHVYSYSDKGLERISDAPSPYHLWSDPSDSNKIFLAHDGVSLLVNKNGKWVDEGRMAKNNQVFLTGISESEGSHWLQTYTKSVYQLARGQHDWSLTRYDQKNGLPDAQLRPLVCNGELLILADDFGIYRFDNNEKRFSQIKNSIEGYDQVIPIKSNLYGTVFVHKAGRRDLMVKKGDFDIKLYAVDHDAADMVFDPISSWKEASLMDDHYLWLGGEQTVVKYDLNLKNNSTSTQKTYIREIILSDSLIFDGLSLVFEEIRLHTPFEDLKISFATPQAHGVEYQYRLLGYDEGWTEFNKQSFKSYSNLWEGNYEFQVRSKNRFQQIGQTAILRMTIVPPLYRSWWAYSFYCALVISAVLLFVRWKNQKLLRINKKLEYLVEQKTIEMQNQTEKLKELDAYKSRFFTNVSHEFRTPLSLLIAPLEEQMRKQEVGTREYQETNLMLRNARLLLRLVNELLNLSQLQSSKMSLNNKVGDILGFARELAASFESAAHVKKLDFNVEINGCLHAEFDHDKLEKIVSNLLSNAIKYTQNGTVTIKMNLREDIELLILEIIDSGIGIPKHKQESIFDYFSVSSDGYGIGLALARQLAELMGGTLKVSSTEGKGSIFRLELPLVSVDNHAPIEYSFQQIEISEPEVLIQNETTEKKPQLLIVEDNLDLQFMMASSLQDTYSIHIANDGRAGFDLALEHVPDLILTDVMMPNEDGLMLTRRLKNDDLTLHIPIILITARGLLEDKIMGWKSGADDYIVKPFVLQELKVRLSNLLEQRKKLATYYSHKHLSIGAVQSASKDDIFLGNLKRFVEQNLSNEEFGVEEIVKYAGISRTQLHRKLAALIAQTPGEFIKAVKMSKASKMLLADGLNIAQVGYQLGYNDPSYFTKAFKAYYGLTPKEYIQNHIIN